MSSTDNFNYSLVKNQEGNFVVRSSVQSFNLDHVTDKDIVSFYKSFSETASFDTGLLPLAGTGVLAIRTAGFQTQIVTQHSAGLYHVNWGAYEGDHSAKAYYVAQPYRIVIGDFEHGNLLGARMFYSPVPITSPSNILYHVNLPNINCKGYRGNGVGWICLYHKDDWSSLPFNEKVSRFIERCSGVETYNDANMSETDGPRFYAQNNKPTYFTDPAEWQKKSDEDSFEWTLDSSLLIPVLVQDMDHQEKHYTDGQPLTLAMAMLGNYQAYYTDTNIPKMYNVISRSDMSLENKHISDFVKRSFASAPVTYSHISKDDPYNFTLEHREKNGSAVLIQPTLFDPDDSWTCNSCEDSYDDLDLQCSTNDGSVCQSCYDEHYIYIASAADAYHYEDGNIHYIEQHSEYFHEDYDTIVSCDSCGENFAGSGKGSSVLEHVMKNLHSNQDGSSHFCLDCFADVINNENLSEGQCFSCSKILVTSAGWNSVYPTVKALTPSPKDGSMSMNYITFCSHCYKDYLVCPCGLVKSSNQEFANCDSIEITSSDNSIKSKISKCCAECMYVNFNPDGTIETQYKPVVENSMDNFLNPDMSFMSTVSYVEISNLSNYEPF